MIFLKKIVKRNIKEAKTNLMLLVIAFICAIASWLIIAMTIYPFVSKTVTDIPISFDTIGTSAADNGLSPIFKSTDHVSVSFDCSRTASSQLNNATIKAYVDFDNVTTAGKRPFSIRIEGPNGVTMSNVVVHPSTVTVELDQFSRKEFTLEAKYPNITSADGTMLSDSEVTCTPAVVSVYGPSSQLAKIDKCYAVCEKSEVINSTKNFTSEKYELLYEDGTTVDLSEKSHIKIENSSIVSIYVPVLTLKTVHLKPLIMGAPSNFDTSCLDYTVTPDTVTIAAKTSDTNLTDPLEFKVALSSLDIGYSQDYDLNALLSASNVVNISDISTFNFKLNSDNLDSKEIVLTKDDISFLNVPNDNYDYTLMTDRLVVKLIGPKGEAFDAITAKDISAVVDFLGADVSMNQYQYDVKISCNTSNNVWEVTNPKVNVKKALKEGYTTSANVSSTKTTNTN
ncbi:MAG: hypothetical protein K6G33_03260 [Ruminococcus sp.]|uniref:CdaR family protein n=1 Tax=Ruminococcus sp. TaxID=41978 RepID=UPI0025FDCDE3|nr:hypothetical protein [Ruminococcus sp.]MCR5599748.1 hypothetical protein [Ruminococcus sp.]